MGNFPVAAREFRAAGPVLRFSGRAVFCPMGGNHPNQASRADTFANRSVDRAAAVALPLNVRQCDTSE